MKKEMENAGVAKSKKMNLIKKDIGPASLTVPLETTTSVPLFLPGAAPKGTDSIWNSPLAEVARLQKSQGIVSPRHLKVGLISFLVMNSARLGYPLGLELVDEDGTSAGRILKAVKKVSPDGAFAEFRDVAKDVLFRESKNLRFRTIIGSDGSRLGKISHDLNEVLDLQEISEHKSLETKYGSFFGPLRVEGPISSIVIVPQNEHVLRNSSSLRMHLGGGEPPSAEVPPFDEAEKIEGELFSGRVKRSFARLQGQPVEIPYMQEVLKLFEGSKIPPQQFESLFRILKVVTLTNNPPSPLLIEAFAGQYGVEQKIVDRYLELQRITANVSAPSTLPLGRLTATKYDLWVFCALLDEMLSSGDDFLGERQTRIFEAIKRTNIGRITNASFAGVTGERETLIAIANADCWIDREQIFDEANKDQGEFISLSTLNRGLEELLKKGFIDRKKPPKSRRYVYAVTTLSIGSLIKLPFPAATDDPVLKEEIQVVDPLTREVRKI